MRFGMTGDMFVRRRRYGERCCELGNSAVVIVGVCVAAWCGCMCVLTLSQHDHESEVSVRAPIYSSLTGMTLCMQHGWYWYSAFRRLSVTFGDTYLHAPHALRIFKPQLNHLMPRHLLLSPISL